MTPGLLPPLVKGRGPMPLPPQQFGPGQPASHKKKAFTLHAWSNIPGKTALFDQLAKLKRKKASLASSNNASSINAVAAHGPPPPPLPSKLHQHHALKAKPTVKQTSTTEWLNVEKSVRFTLPPNEVKKRSKTNSRVTFIPKEDLIQGNDQPANANLNVN